LHILLDVPIHNLQAWWRSPLGPPLHLAPLNYEL
jgi:hypothetical protein